MQPNSALKWLEPNLQLRQMALLDFRCRFGFHWIFDVRLMFVGCSLDVRWISALPHWSASGQQKSSFDRSKMLLKQIPVATRQYPFVPVRTRSYPLVPTRAHSCPFVPKNTATTPNRRSQQSGSNGTSPDTSPHSDRNGTAPEISPHRATRTPN